jgi:serine/threonine protein kinase
VGLPLGQALAIARQITDALEVAHDKGIIHRDLKPANIKITPHGAVKVLDFGLAKAVGGEGASPDLSNAPVEDGGRREGAIIGTAAYMSPEQARGLPVDKRTDIWSFGCVLYELLTGRVTFAGDTVSDSIARILEREPDWSALPVATPASVRRLLLRCLAKDPKKRLRDIGDVRIEIDAIDEVLPGPIAALARRPWSLVASVSRPPIRAGELTRTIAPGRTPPCASLTVPMRAPVSPCAAASLGSRTQAVTSSKTHRSNRSLVIVVLSHIGSEKTRWNVERDTNGVAVELSERRGPICSTLHTRRGGVRDES